MTTTRFLRDFDLGLLRERPACSMSYEAWIDGLWHAVTFDPFTASMSEITPEAAEAIAGERLHAPAEDELYAKITADRLGAHGAH